MIDREDIVFATCHQLGQLISSEWENPPEEVELAIEGLRPIDEPGGEFYGSPLVNNPLRLSPSEKEPDSISRAKKLIELKMVAAIFKKIMEHSDGWKTQNAETLKKEIVSRITTYEEAADDITRPVPVTCHIKL